MSEGERVGLGKFGDCVTMFRCQFVPGEDGPMMWRCFGHVRMLPMCQGALSAFSFL